MITSDHPRVTQNQKPEQSLLQLGENAAARLVSDLDGLESLLGNLISQIYLYYESSLYFQFEWIF